MAGGGTIVRRLLIVELWFSFIDGSYNGAMIVALTEIMPVEVRTAGFSLAYSLATAIFGGFIPAMSDYLIQRQTTKQLRCLADVRRRLRLAESLKLNA